MRCVSLWEYMMKKRQLLFFVILIGLVLSYWLYQGSRVRYPAGTDTGISFGDGTFQILTGSRDSLYQIPYNTCLIEQVEDVLVRSGKVYVVGSVPDQEGGKDFLIYAVITMETNQIRLCFVPQNDAGAMPYIHRLDEMLENQDALLLTDLHDFSEEEQQIFQEMNEKTRSQPVKGLAVLLGSVNSAG